jgi:F-type H+-transporting ATPase subunit gamma
VKPSTDEVVRALVSRQISNKVFRVILNAAASEHGARMTAMDSATNNAREVILKLTLDYNRGRQAAITTELIEITSGASAL